MDKSKRIIKITDEANSKIYVQNDDRPTISFLSAATLVVKRLLLPNSEIYFSSVQKIDFDDSVIQIHIHDEYNVHYVNIEDSNVVIDWTQGSFIISIEPSNIENCNRPEVYYEINETNKAKNMKVYARLKQDGLLTYFMNDGIDGVYDEDKIKKLEKLIYPIKEDNYLLYHNGIKYQILKIKQTPQYFSEKEVGNLYTECIYDTFDEFRVERIFNCSLVCRISNLDMYTFDERTIFVDTLNDNKIIKGFEDDIDETLMKTYTSEDFRIKHMELLQKFKTLTPADSREKYFKELYKEDLVKLLFGDSSNKGVNIVFLLENEIIDLRSSIDFHTALIDLGSSMKRYIDRNIENLNFEYNK